MDNHNVYCSECVWYEHNNENPHDKSDCCCNVMDYFYQKDTWYERGGKLRKVYPDKKPCDINYNNRCIYFASKPIVAVKK